MAILPETYGKTWQQNCILLAQNGKLRQLEYFGSIVGSAATEIFIGARNSSNTDRLYIPTGTRVLVTSRIAAVLGDGTTKLITGTHTLVGGGSVTVAGAFNIQVAGTADTTFVFAANGTQGVSLTMTGSTGTNVYRVHLTLLSIDPADDLAD